MPKSLQLALWVILVVLALLGLLKFALHYAGRLILRLLVKAGEAMSKTQPRRVSLLPRDNVEWAAPKEVAQLLQELEQAGFVDCGRYEIREMKGARLHGLIHQEHRIAAVINELKGHANLDLLAHTADGRQVCFSNHKLGFSMARPEHHVQVTYPGDSAIDLLNRILNQCPEEERKGIPVERFAFWYEETYAQQARWMAERGGPTFEETVEMVKAMGEKASEATLREMYESTTEGYLKNWLQDQPDITDSVWEEIEFELTVVHAGLRLETMVERFNCVVPDEKEITISDVPPEVTDAREAFSFLNKRAGLPFRHFKGKEIGLAADFYLEPGWEDQREESGDSVAA